MANSTMKLYYFDGKGRGEVARLIFAAAGKEFEDIRFNLAGWPKYKPLMPFGQVPALEVDGKIYSQSLAINTFLAREFGFYPTSNLDGLKVDQIVQLIEDIVKLALDVMHMREGEEKEKAVVTVRQEKSPKFLGFLEQLLKDSGSEYFVGNQLTLADITVFDMLTGFMKKYVDLNDNYPSLKKFLEVLLAHEKLGPYISSRPVSAF